MAPETENMIVPMLRKLQADIDQLKRGVKMLTDQSRFQNEQLRVLTDSEFRNSETQFDHDARLTRIEERLNLTD